MHRIALAALAFVTAGVVLASPAAADPFGNYNGDGTGPIPDSFNHTYCWSSGWTSGWNTYGNYAMGNLDAQTSYYDTYDSTCDSATDILWQLNSSISARGDYVCNAFNSSGYCSRATIRLNPSLLTDNQNRNKTACHEIGHSVGLQHGNSKTDCMINGAVSSGTQWITYNSHHISHANSRTPAAS